MRDLISSMKNMQADEIRQCLFSEKYLEEEYICIGGISYKLCDAASLFVTTAYLLETPADRNEKDKLRKEAYTAFLENNKSMFPDAWDMIDLLTENRIPGSDPKIRILKGGSYKIKNYYLENYKLRDIRGASVLLTHIEEDVIPDMISKRFIPECIVYSGGGNIFAVVPESCEDSFAIELERAAKSLLVSADIAYYISDEIRLSDIFGDNYRRKMVEVENSLNERKKLIINCTKNAESEFIGRSIKVVCERPEDCFEAAVNGTPADHELICNACGKRNADYTAGKEVLCTSCLHKRAVGDAAKRSRYINRYKLYNSSEPEAVSTLEDISDKYIAVIYGDGNNMGGIIQKFAKITQMMEFSRDVKSIVEKSVFESMKEHHMTRFEVVGLGGDDVFIIVEGNKAIKFTVSMIEKYNSQFEKYRSSGQVSTMSAGIAIAKYDMPIRIIIDKSKEKLSEAKSIAKLKTDNCGSLSYEIIDTFDGGTSDEPEIPYGAADTMLPFYTDTAKDIIAMADKFKREINKTRLRNVLDAFTSAESADEANLFLGYFNAKSTETAVKLLPAAGYSVDGGFYVDSGGKKYIAWKDILTILDYID